MLTLHRRLLGMILLTCALPAAAQVYKWTDAQGKIHYTDRAADASDGRSTEVKVAPAQSASTIQQGQDWRAREADYKKRQAAATTAQWRTPTTYSKGNNIPNNVSRDPLNRQICELARNVLSGKPELNHRSAAAPRDRKTAMRDAESSCR